MASYSGLWTGQPQDNEHLCDYLQFYEFFRGDTGRRLGAFHQTGWAWLGAWLLMPRKQEGMIITKEQR